jgi:hypothetical protein
MPCPKCPPGKDNSAVGRGIRENGTVIHKCHKCEAVFGIDESGNIWVAGDDCGRSPAAGYNRPYRDSRPTAYFWVPKTASSGGSIKLRPPAPIENLIAAVSGGALDNPFGLYTASIHGVDECWCCYPYYDIDGALVLAKKWIPYTPYGKRDKDKYIFFDKHAPETVKRFGLFGLNAIAKTPHSDTLLVVEGEKTAVIIKAAYPNVAVVATGGAACGTSATALEQIWFLGSEIFKNIALLPDNDLAGNMWLDNLYYKYSFAAPRCNIYRKILDAPLAEGEDFADFLIQPHSDLIYSHN